jgi:hypothetical protein
MIGTLFGVVGFLALLLFAVQLILNLYATSVVTAVGFDAARMVAGADAGDGVGRDESAARAHVENLLGAYQERGSLDLTFTYGARDANGLPDVVNLRLQADHPTRLLPKVSFPYQTVDRTFTVRIEEVR